MYKLTEISQGFWVLRYEDYRPELIEFMGMALLVLGTIAVWAIVK